MSENLWTLSGIPSSFDVLPRRTSDIWLEEVQIYVLTFSARSPLSVKIRTSLEHSNFYDTALSPEWNDFTFEFACTRRGRFRMEDLGVVYEGKESSIEINNINLFRKPLALVDNNNSPVLSRESIISVVPRKNLLKDFSNWNKHYAMSNTTYSDNNYGVYFDLSQAWQGLTLIVYIEKDYEYTFTCESTKGTFRIYDGGVRTAENILADSSGVTFVSSSSYIEIVLSSGPHTNGTGFNFKNPMLHKGGTIEEFEPYRLGNAPSKRLLQAKR